MPSFHPRTYCSFRTVDYGCEPAQLTALWQVVAIAYRWHRPHPAPACPLVAAATFVSSLGQRFGRGPENVLAMTKSSRTGEMNILLCAATIVDCEREREGEGEGGGGGEWEWDEAEGDACIAKCSGESREPLVHTIFGLALFCSVQFCSFLICLPFFSPFFFSLGLCIQYCFPF